MGQEVKIFLLGPLSIERRGADGTWSLVENWTQARAATRSFLRRLITAPGRRLSRGALQEDLWPELSQELADKYTNNASSQIRAVIGRDLLRIVESSLYELAGQAQIWTDLDEAAALLRQAEDTGLFTEASITLLEEALTLLTRGPALEGEEEGTWCYGIRRQAEDMLRQCRLWLAQGYEARDKLWQASEQYRVLCQVLPPDEEALQAWIAMLARHGKRQEATRCYQEVREYFATQGIALSPEAGQAGGILSVVQELGGPYVPYSRRQILSAGLTTACTALTLSPYRFFQVEQHELLASTQHSSRLSASLVDDLSGIIRSYWKLSANTSRQLLGGLFGLFQDITQLLNTAQTPALAQELFSLASQAAQILGKTLCDLRDYPLALSYYTFAAKAATEAQGQELWAAALGRMSLLFLSTDRPQQALSLLREVQVTKLRSKRMRSWCAAITAEAYSSIGEPALCVESLELSSGLSEAAFQEADPYASGFTPSRLASYTGSCYLRLGQPQQALPALEQALTLLAPAAVRNRSRLLAYLGESHALLGNVQQACTSASQALDLTYQTQSLDILHRVERVSKSLANKGMNADIRDLRARLQEARVALVGIGGSYE